YQRGIEATAGSGDSEDRTKLVANYLRCSAIYSKKPDLEEFSSLAPTVTCPSKRAMFRGLALFKNGKYEESLQQYQEAFNSLNHDEKNDQVKRNLLLAMALVLRKMGDSAKTLLLKTIEDADPSYSSLLCLIFNSFLDKDNETLELALEEF